MEAHGRSGAMASGNAERGESTVFDGFEELGKGAHCEEQTDFSTDVVHSTA
jgi:hypothetical protein